MQVLKNKRSKEERFKIFVPPNSRRLKIQSRCVDRGSKRQFLPVIILSGQWLENLGFEVDFHVFVESKDGNLIIRLDP